MKSPKRATTAKAAKVEKTARAAKIAKAAKGASASRKAARKLTTRRRATLGPDSEHTRLVQELEIHRVELELQNEELRSARATTDSALERYTEIFDFAPLGYVLIGIDGVIKEVNHAGATLLGDERARLVGRRFAHFLDGDSRSAFDALLRDAHQGSRPVRMELELVRDMYLFPVRMTAAALHRGEPGVMVAFEDISERRAKEVELARTERALRDASARKDEFLAMLSHELRNPLSPIRTSITVMQIAPPGSDEAENALAIIDRSTAHLTRLVDDLLDITRIARGKVELQREPVDLCSLVRDTIDDHAYACAQRALTVATTFHVDEAWVFGDRARLVQVLSNIIGNAEKFTPSGGRIHVEVSSDGGRVVVTVTDTGIGIAPDMLSRVFEPFAQAPQALDRAYGGLGLGLAMVKSILDLHGGKTSVRSPGLDRGVAVTIDLPLETRRTPATRHQAVATQGRKVLVVEDKVDSAEALRYALTLKGHNVEIAHNGRTAVELALKFGPDVIFCDVGLPDMDGYAVARQLRLSAEMQHVCLVALSGYARAEDVARAREAGFDRHIAKPPRLEDLDLVLAQPVRGAGAA